MENGLFYFALVGLNFILFTLFDVSSKIKIGIDKKKLFGLAVLFSIGGIILLLRNFDAFELSFYMTIALGLILAARFFFYKAYDLPSKKKNKVDNIMSNVFDGFLFPFFVLFISFAQFMYLFVWA